MINVNNCSMDSVEYRKFCRNVKLDVSPSVAGKSSRWGRCLLIFKKGNHHANSGDWLASDYEKSRIDSSNQNPARYN